MFAIKPEEILYYLRKSRQDDPNETIEEVLFKHRMELDKWATNHLSGPVPQKNIYMERVSGETIKDRAAFQALLKRMESPTIRAVVAVDTPRLGRGDLEDAGKIINTFRYTNTLFITPHRTYDLSDESDLFFFEMELKQGNQYLEYTRKNMARGKNIASERGCFLAPRAPFGYRKIEVNKCKTLEFDENIEWLRKIYELADSGRSIASIASFLQENGVPTLSGRPWNRQSVEAILKNVTNTGKVRWRYRQIKKNMVDGIVEKRAVVSDDYILVDGLHPAAVSEELFNRVNRQCVNAPRVKKETEMINPFSGIMYCCEDHFAMSMRKNYKNGKMYITCKNQKYCHNGSAPLYDVIGVVQYFMEKEIESFRMKLLANDHSEIDDYNRSVSSLEERIQKLNEKELKYWKDRYEPGGVQMPDTVFASLMDELKQSRDSLSARLEDLKSSPPVVIDYEEKIREFTDVSNALGDTSLDARTKNELAKRCIRKIYYKRKPGPQGNFSDKYDERPIELDIEFNIL